MFYFWLYLLSGHIIFCECIVVGIRKGQYLDIIEHSGRNISLKQLIVFKANTLVLLLRTIREKSKLMRIFRVEAWMASFLLVLTKLWTDLFFSSVMIEGAKAEEEKYCCSRKKNEIMMHRTDQRLLHSHCENDLAGEHESPKYYCAPPSTMPFDLPTSFVRWHR